MHDSNISELLARYLSGECSQAEEREVEVWLNADPANPAALESMKAVWQTPEPGFEPSDVNRLWQEVAQQTGIASGADSALPRRTLTAVRPASGWRRFPAPDTYNWLRYAAFFVAILSVGFLLSRAGSHLMPWSQDPEQVTLNIPNGQRQTVTLDDGTSIALDAGSTLHYPERFSGSLRTVVLAGEGYFEVASNPDKPFVIQANHAVVTVLGTKFNVRAWQSDEKVTVAVAEGKVSLAPNRENAEARVVLTENQISTLTPDSGPSVPRVGDVASRIAWMQNEVAFEDAPLSEILNQLERWYDVRFVLADSSAAAERLTVHIKSRSIDEILELISMLTDLRFVHNGNEIGVFPED